MKRILSFFLIICTLLCGNVFAADNYKTVDMKDFQLSANFLKAYVRYKTLRADGGDS